MFFAKKLREQVPYPTLGENVWQTIKAATEVKDR